MAGLKGVKKVSQKDRKEFRTGQVGRVPKGTIRKAKDMSDEGIDIARLIRSELLEKHGDNLDAAWREAEIRSEENDPNIPHVAAVEHYFYARKTVREDPIQALGFLINVPGYGAYKYINKRMGKMQKTSDPSYSQQVMGYEGIIDGLKDAVGHKEDSDE